MRISIFKSKSEYWFAAASLAKQASEAAAIACAPWRGKNDKISADQAAVTAISNVLNGSNFSIFVAIGEGELDDAPMLSVGDTLGRKESSERLDMAVDPLEGTTLCSKNLPGAVTAIAFSSPNSLLSAPDSYMQKIMAGPRCPKELVDVDRPIRGIIIDYADATGKPLSGINICVLDKPRHISLVSEIKSLGANVVLIPDVDVPAAIWVCDPDRYGIDFYMGTGGGPEGVLSAAALKCLGGQMSARFKPQDSIQYSRLLNHNPLLIDKKFTLDELVSGDVVFCMSSITGSKNMQPINITSKIAVVETMMLSSFFETVEQSTSRIKLM